MAFNDLHDMCDTHLMAHIVRYFISVQGVPNMGCIMAMTDDPVCELKSSDDF